MVARQPHLPLGTGLPPRRRVDALTARALRLALWPATWDVEAAAGELLRLAGGSPLVLAAAVTRLQRAGGEEAGVVEARAEHALHVAYQRACRQSRSALPDRDVSA